MLYLGKKNRQIFKSGKIFKRLKFTRFPTAKNGDFLEIF